MEQLGYRETHKQLEVGAPTVLPLEFISHTDIESRFMMLVVLYQEGLQSRLFKQTN
jgi:hypothetical protein